MASTLPAAAKFDREDTVRVKGKPHLVGTVCLTSQDIDPDEILEDVLVLSYTSVPQNELLKYMETGKPPLGYVFVEFVKTCHGYSLIHEDDLELVDRFFELGTPVKSHLQSPFSGIVISMSTICSLQPIAYQPVNPRNGDYGPLKFSEKPSGRAVWPSAVDLSDDGPPELDNVQMSELTYHEPFREGSLIIYRQKVGKIRSIERDAVLLLSNQKVTSIHDYDQVETPILANTQDVVVIPERLGLFHKHPLADGRHFWSSSADLAVPGEYATTSANNLNRNDLRMDTGATVEPEGYLLAITATDYDIDWVCPNIFAVGLPYKSPTSERLGAATVHEHAVKCDWGQLPKDALSEGKSVATDMCLEVGDLVRFRDPADATRKYPKYRCIPTDESFGYDLNILRIVSVQKEITVRWQDGRITTEAPASLHEFDRPEEEIWPGDVVVLKEAIEILHEPLFGADASSSTNGPEIIVENYRPKKVGVVQTVDGGERIASVRWYENPSVELTHKGWLLKSGSSLGALGSTVTDVSCYELTTYSCLSPSLGSIVLLVPGTVHQAALPPHNPCPNLRYAGFCQISLIMPRTFHQTFLYLEAMKTYISHTDWFKNSISIDTSPVPSRFSLHYREFNVNAPANFFGKVIARDTDGSITVRVAAANNCHDICVPLERLMLVVDGDAISPDALPVPDTASPWVYLAQEDLNGVLDGMQWDGDHSINPSDNNGGEHFLESDNEPEGDGIANNPEYFDEDETDAGDENEGEFHELDEDPLGAPVATDISLSEDPEQHEECKNLVDRAEASPVPGKFTTLVSSPAECPPAFALLEGPPPSDHHFLASDQKGCSGMISKRIYKEYGILRTSLPPGIVVRAWESRIDLLRVLIIGPEETPYEYAPFVIDIHFDNKFPDSPPTTYFHSWTNNAGPINPNLYEDGTICLSILGTWTAKNPEEGWLAAKSTVLQVLVSIMGLVLVKAPFYNEAGYEIFAGGSKLLESAQYTEKAFLMTRKFIQHALEHPVTGMEDVLAWHYLPASTPQEGSNVRPLLLRRAIETGLEMIGHHNRTTASDELDETSVASAFIRRLSLGAVVMLRKHIAALEHIESTKGAQTGS